MPQFRKRPVVVEAMYATRGFRYAGPFFDVEVKALRRALEEAGA